MQRERQIDRYLYIDISIYLSIYLSISLYIFLLDAQWGAKAPHFARPPDLQTLDP